MIHYTELSLYVRCRVIKLNCFQGNRSSTPRIDLPWSRRRTR